MSAPLELPLEVWARVLERMPYGDPVIALGYHQDQAHRINYGYDAAPGRIFPATMPREEKRNYWKAFCNLGKFSALSCTHLRLVRLHLGLSPSLPSEEEA